MMFCVREELIYYLPPARDLYREPMMDVILELCDRSPALSRDTLPSLLWEFRLVDSLLLPPHSSLFSLFADRPSGGLKG